MSSTPYDRQTSFALFSAENPTSQQSGSDLDAEFNAVKIALDDTQQNLSKIQDDDGVLKRGSVGQAQFDSSVTLGFAAPAQWASGVVYTKDISTVFYNSVFYIANTTHTSGVSFDAANWDEIADFTAAAAIPDGSITSAKLADGAVAANKLADGVVANSKLATGSVTTNKIADAQVTFEKLAAGIGPDLANLIIPAGLGPIPWSGTSLPTGWDWADGGVLLTNTPYPALRARYIADGFPYGQDGSGNPKKPDQRGRALAGADLMNGSAAARLTAASGMTGIGPGSAGGSEVVTLATPQLPSVTPSGSVASTLNLSTDATKLVIQGGGGSSPFSASAGAAYSVTNIVPASSVSSTFTGNAFGGSQSHNNVQPTLTHNMIIKAH